MAAAAPAGWYNRLLSTTFLITSLVIVATPGTGALFTIAAGLSRGARASLVAALACTLGIVPHMLAAVTGVAALLHASAVAFQVLKYLGVAYLLWMAWATFRQTGALVAEGDGDAVPVRRVLAAGVLINILNPKLTIFFFAFLPQFVDPGSAGVPQMLWLSGVFMALTLAVFALYGVFAAAVRRHVISRPRVVAWMRRTFGASFLALGAKLAVSDR